MLAWGSTDFIIILAHSCRGRLFSLDARAYIKWQYRLGLCGNLLFLEEAGERAVLLRKKTFFKVSEGGNFFNIIDVAEASLEGKPLLLFHFALVPLQKRNRGGLPFCARTLGA